VDRRKTLGLAEELSWTWPLASSPLTRDQEFLTGIRHLLKNAATAPALA
jgi:hypothetical protein